MTCHCVQAAPQWGVDSRISHNPSSGNIAFSLEEATSHNLLWLREPSVSRMEQDTHLHNLRKIQSADLNVISVYRGSRANRKENSLIYGRLNPNLLEVFQHASDKASQMQGLIDVWELANEPDLAFVKAMPDQYTAWAKAAYLGIKNSPSPPSVLMGSMGLPPGHYLKQFARNGGLFYTDAFNQHYYGHPEHFSPTMKTVRHRIRDYHQRGMAPYPAIPLWITECGFRAGFNRESRQRSDLRQRQADNIAAYAKAAASADVDVFLAYCLFRHTPFAFFDTATGKPFPSWAAYTSWTRTHRSPDRSIPVQAAPDPSPIVCQWRPAARRSQPHKVAASYRFRPDRIDGHFSMAGEVRLHNFSPHPVAGTLQWDIGEALRATIRGEMGLEWFRQGIYSQLKLTIPARGYVEVPFLFSSNQEGYFRSPVQLSFQAEQHPRPGSWLSFSLESPLDLADFSPVDVAAHPPYSARGRIRSWLSMEPALAPENFHFHYIDLPQNASLTSIAGPWLGLNGIRVESPAASNTENRNSIAAPWNFTLEYPISHPNQVPTAITRISGLPENAILHLSTDRIMETGFAARVDLVDKHGRRFTVYEWYGLQRGQLNQSAWLNLDDFHLYGWGEIDHRPFDPDEVREIHLRFHFNQPHQAVPFSLKLLTPLPQSHPPADL